MVRQFLEAKTEEEQFGVAVPIAQHFCPRSFDPTNLLQKIVRSGNYQMAASYVKTLESNDLRKLLVQTMIDANELKAANELVCFLTFPVVKNVEFQVWALHLQEDFPSINTVVSKNQKRDHFKYISFWKSMECRDFIFWLLHLGLQEVEGAAAGGKGEVSDRSLACLRK